MKVKDQKTQQVIAEIDLSGVSVLEVLEDSQTLSKIAVESKTMRIALQLKPRFFVLVQQYNSVE